MSVSRGQVKVVRRTIAAVLMVVGMLAGCGEDPDEAAFRRELVEKALNDDNRRAGEAFLAENATREGVVSLPSGLQYRVIRAGAGATPGADSQVRVHYEGRLIDGTLFDSSYARGEPVTFPLGRVIQGWREGLHLMREGAEWMLFVPPDLAYGAASPSPAIAPNSTLIFKVELLEVISQ